jgi:hypothetical protein
MKATTEATLPFPLILSKSAKRGHILPDLKTGSLISIGQLCDDDCTALFTKHHLKIFKNGTAIITGRRNTSNGLWHIPMPPVDQNQATHTPLPPSPQANSIIRLAQTKQDLARYLHASALNPQISTLLRAIRRGHFLTWPNLTSTLITKHLPKSLFTSKGHLRMQQKNIQSTKIQKSKSNQTQTVEDSLPLSISLDVSPAQELTNSPTHNLFVAIHHTLDLKNKSYSDQTGRFPHLSSRGHQYIMILYDYDTNLILSLPLKHRRAADITN